MPTVCTRRRFEGLREEMVYMMGYIYRHRLGRQRSFCRSLSLSLHLKLSTADTSTHTYSKPSHNYNKTQTDIYTSCASTLRSSPPSSRNEDTVSIPSHSPTLLATGPQHPSRKHHDASDSYKDCRTWLHKWCMCLYRLGCVLVGSIWSSPSRHSTGG